MELFNTADRVDYNVYIGGYLAAADPEFIRNAGITRIVKLFADTRAPPHPGVKYLVTPVKDSPDYDIRPAAVAAVKFIWDGILNNERTLVHCHAGVSRSAAIVLFHLMLNRGYILDMALARLRLVRPAIRPNPGFMAHLRATDARARRLRVGDEQKYIAPPPAFPDPRA